MKHYSQSLDYVALAMAKGREGKLKTAAKLFAKAIAQPDVLRAIATLEVSNKQAYAVQASEKANAVKAAALTAAKPAAKSATKAAAAPAAKPAAKPAVKAAKKVVAEFDFGDDEDMEALVGAEDEEVDVGEPEVVEDEMADEGNDMEEEEVEEDAVVEGATEDDEDEDFAAQFASVLATMVPKAVAQAKSKQKK